MVAIKKGNLKRKTVIEIVCLKAAILIMRKRDSDKIMNGLFPTVSVSCQAARGKRTIPQV
jgi:hypothetical protein